MLNAQELQSEISHLLTLLREENVAIEQAFTWLVDDADKYTFIMLRMDKIQEIRRQLHELVGATSIAMIAKELEMYAAKKDK